MNLNEAFDFEGLQSIKSRANFIEEGLPSISAASRDFFLLSSKYFDVRGAGDQLILRDLISFSKPTAAGQLELSGPQFSFTAWVRADAVSQEGECFFLRLIIQWVDACVAEFRERIHLAEGFGKGWERAELLGVVSFRLTA